MRVAHCGQQAGGHRFGFRAELGMYGCHDDVEPAERILVLVERAGIENVALDAGEQPKIRAHAGVHGGHGLQLAFEPLGAQAVGDRQPRRVIGQNGPPVAQGAGRTGHVLERAAAVRPVGVQVAVPGARGREVPAGAGVRVGFGLEAGEVARYRSCRCLGDHLGGGPAPPPAALRPVRLPPGPVEGRGRRRPRCGRPAHGTAMLRAIRGGRRSGAELRPGSWQEGSTGGVDDRAGDAGGLVGVGSHRGLLPARSGDGLTGSVGRRVDWHAAAWAGARGDARRRGWDGTHRDRHAEHLRARGRRGAGAVRPRHPSGRRGTPRTGAGRPCAGRLRERQLRPAGAPTTAKSSKPPSQAGTPNWSSRSRRTRTPSSSSRHGTPSSSKRHWPTYWASSASGGSCCAGA
ncbi:hypothetical protein SLAV_06435 [Streptomyces lavendulae subsp. lavendulae]|uniref:Uncharacterized protein n=1 Tax=Streptomyces lavendulae subsp. lavendulae TaxID=58340 RepID=A0A2K8P8X2_STRLA|nr:hypothetical protein SLAV_06435 [Streptomyces lavendulae subsp. lavendulae]QUQ53028.1 hypothetical protein SLLC_04455 [Streptomyces lavendulae subsp. lavendulae]